MDKKADILYLIMGTNPFPNLISAITRVKDNGSIVCICTKETAGKPFERFKEVIKRKIETIYISRSLVDDNSDRYSIKEALERDLEQRLCRSGSNILLELNYTGGTKVMSSVAYEVMRNCKYGNEIEINLTYIDAEREKMYYEYKKSGKTSFARLSIQLGKLDTKYNLTISDIIKAHNITHKNHEEKMKAEIKKEKLSMELGSLFCNIDEYTYNCRTKFIKDLYCLAKKSKNAGNLENNINILLKKTELPLSYKTCDDFGFSSNGEIIKYFESTKWLEEYIIRVFLDLREEGIIDDVVANYKKKENEEENDFEVDIIVYRKYKLFAVSVTSASKVKDARPKLYEIKQRAKDLAGDETAICYINLCWDTTELEKRLINIWDNSKPKNALILDVQSFGNLKEKLTNWIKRGDTFGC